MILSESRCTETDKYLEGSPLGVRINCLLSAYGTQYDFFKVYYIFDKYNSLCGVIGKLDFDMTLVCSENAPFEEIRAFLDLSDWHSFCCDSKAAVSLGYAGQRKTMYKYTGSVPDQFSSYADYDLREIYKLVSDAIPGSFSDDHDSYLSFLSDFTFRRRRGLARLSAVEVNCCLAACAFTSAESRNGAIISGVACKKDMRGSGHGKAAVLSLVKTLLKTKNDIYVIALEKQAGNFYKKIGFTEICEIEFIYKHHT